MKTKLLSFILMTILFTSITNAQSKVWDFSNSTTWPITGSGVGTIGADTQAVIDNLGLFSNAPGNTAITNFGSTNASNATFTDGFTGATRFQMNGGGYPSAGGFIATPTQRFLFMDVSGACTVKVWFKTGSNGSVRTIFVTNGVNTIGSAATNSGGNLDVAIVTATYTGGAGRLYIYGDASNNLYKVSVTGATVNTVLANTDVQLESPVKVYSNGNQIYLANILSKTQVEVYSMTGSLVKSFSTEADTNFDVSSTGVYIVNVNSAEGKKSVKLVVQ